jgi:hypothetical protein
MKTDLRICIKDFYREKIMLCQIAASLTTIARARNSGNAPKWSSTNSLNESSGMNLIPRTVDNFLVRAFNKRLEI